MLAGGCPPPIAAYAPGQADRLRSIAADAMRVDAMPGPPPTALVANLPYNVSVPVLLHLLALLPSLRARPGDGAGRGRRPAGAPPGSKVYGVPVGQGRLVRRRATRRRGRPQGLLAGAQRRLRPGRLDARAAGGPRSHRAEVFAVVDAAFAQRRKTLRSASAGWAGSAAAAEAALVRAQVDPRARGEALDVAEFARIASART